jgi:hypothetical protein
VLLAWSDPASNFYHVDDPKIRAIAPRESSSRNIASLFFSSQHCRITPLKVYRLKFQ